MLKNLSFRKIMFFVTAVYAAAHLFYLTKYPTAWSDEFFYTEPSWYFLRHGTFGTTLHPDIAGIGATNIYEGRIFLFLNALIFRLIGYTFFALRLQPYLMGLLTLWLTFKTVERMFSTRAAVFSCALLAVSTLFVVGFHAGRPDMTVAVFVIGTLYLFWTAQERKPACYFWTGLLASLAVDVHPPSGIAAIGGLGLAAAYRLIRERMDRQLWNWRMVLWTGLGLAAGTGWWVSVHYLPHPDIYNEQMAFRVKEQPPVWSKPKAFLIKEYHRYKGFFWNSRYHRNMFVLLVLTLSGLYFLSRRGSEPHMTVILFLIGALFAIMIVAVNTPAYYFIGVYPLFATCMGVFLSEFTASEDKLRKRAGLALCSGLIALYAVENAYWICHYRKADYSAYTAKIRKFIPENATIMCRTYMWHGFKDRKAYNDQFLFVWIYAPAYYSRQMGADYEEVFDNLGIEYYVRDEDFVAWDEDKVMKDFLNRRGKLVGTVEDAVYGRTTFYPGIKKTFIYRIDSRAQ